MQVYRLYMIIDKQGTVVTLYTCRCVQYNIKMTNHPSPASSGGASQLPCPGAIAMGQVIHLVKNDHIASTGARCGC